VAGTESQDGAEDEEGVPGSEMGKMKRFILEMRNPVTVRYDESLTVPLMGMSFNHMVWIEQEKGPGYGKTAYKVRFVKFPDPSSCPTSSSSAASSSSLSFTPSSSLASSSYPNPETDARAEHERGTSDDKENERGRDQGYTIETLTDIDADVAEMAYQILLEPTMAAIMITTRTNYFYRYQYA